jgi:hypothetical protein
MCVLSVAVSVAVAYEVSLISCFVCMLKRELEENEERVRTFYTKKVEEITRRHEQQMRALKRGTDDAATIPAVPAVVNANAPETAILPSPPLPPPQVAHSLPNLDGDQRLSEGQEGGNGKIVELESQLSAVTEEIRLLRANELQLKDQLQRSKAAKVDIEQEVESRVKMALAAGRAEIAAEYEQQVKSLREERDGLFSGAHRRQTELQDLLHEEKNRCMHLVAELNALKSVADQPRHPSMQHFMVNPCPSLYCPYTVTVVPAHMRYCCRTTL